MGMSLSPDTDAREDRPSEFVEALAKGLAILETFDENHPDMTLSEVAKRVGLSPAAARRSLLTLKALGYVGQEGKRFHLRPKIMALGSSFYFSARIEEVLLPDLRSLVERFGDASSVATLDGHSVIYVAHHSRQRARRAAAVAGAVYPAFATSMGRVLVAAKPDDELADWLDRLEPVPLTSKTCLDKARLRDELMQVRANGYATTVDQLDYGITALAVAVRDTEGNTIAALNTSGYTGLVTPEQLVAERLPELRAIASHIASQLSRYPVLATMLRS
ncbi:MULTISPECIES: IclR family transcriptional regulator C-terminal domain-containing protein [unclassified Chelatococcus]|uniref:IclR family transcriptional regulator domain-containing protein n=1 Tax=unclassified Chelatococcus TaxID=2638111 RepID=UPI0006BCF958|nr:MULTISPECIES: IclR family transcriptional regulator C-terminal domain-containing protein [unclassified Chelatococcus]ALA17713.1 IclR family transcriptional regulator [Chelatococcus sp. CO-6]